MKNTTRDRRRRYLASFLAIILLMGGTLTPTARMQAVRPANTPPAKPPQVRRKVVKIDPRVVRSVPRAPMVFKPLEMVDPRTGKAVTPTTMLTLDKGRQITAAQYYEQMNKLEAGLNKMGHSFRDQQKEVVTNEVMIDRAKTLSQIRSMPSVTPNAKMAAKLDKIAAAHRDYIKTVNPYFGKRAPRNFIPKIPEGLYQQKVMVPIYQIITVKPSSPISFKVLERPDLVPGDIYTSGIGKDAETLPGISSDPGWATGGKQASAIQINASWMSGIAFYVNYNYYAPNTPPGPTAPLAPKYVYQIAKANSNLDNFGSFSKAWATDFDDKEWVNWKNPPGLIASGDVSFYNGGPQNIRGHLFDVDFGKIVGAPPETPVNYVVRVIPVHADGSIAGYPSRPVLVNYGTHPEFKPPPYKLPPPPPPDPPAVIAANHVDEDAPSSFGDPSVASLDLDTWLKSDGSPAQESASVGFKTGATVFGQPFNFLKISVQGAVTPYQIKENEDGRQIAVGGNAIAEASILTVGGLEICETCQAGKQVGYIKFDASHSIEESFTLSFPIGPIDVSATIGISGTVGAGGKIDLNTSSRGDPLNISIGPHLSVSVYIAAGVGIGAGGFDVLEVGVQGTVNLISAGFVVGVKLPFRGHGNGEYYGRVSELTALSGTLDGYAKAGICPFCKKWTTTLFSWDGYNLLGTDPNRATLFAGNF